MHEECCAHVHVDAVFCKCNSYLYYFGNFALTNFRKASPIGKRTNLQLGHLSLMETRMYTAGKFGTKVCNRMFEEGYVTFLLRYRSLDGWFQNRYDVWTADTTSVSKL
jgi:hypothetical protein